MKPSTRHRKRVRLSTMHSYSIIVTIRITAKIFILCCFIARPCTAGQASNGTHNAAGQAGHDTQAVRQTANQPVAAISVDDLLAGLAKREAAIENLACTVSYVAKWYYADRDGKPLGKRRFDHEAAEVRSIGLGSWIVASSGKSWCNRTGKTTYIRADGSELAEAFESEATFDGSLGRHMHTRIHADGFRHPLGLVSDGFVDEGPSPLEYTTHCTRLPVSRVLSLRPSQIAGQETWEDRSVVVAETTPAKNGQEYKTQFWIDPARGFVVVRRLTLVRYGGGKNWLVSEDTGSLAHREVAPGIWLPERFETKIFAVPSAELAELPLAEEVKGRMSDWQVNQPVSDAKFKLEFPPEVRARGIRFLSGTDRT